MIQFSVAGINYQSGKMPAIVQFHVMRRLLPVIAKVAQAFKPDDNDNDKAERAKSNLFGSLGPIAEAIAGLSDDDGQYVLENCLLVVHRENEHKNGWSRIWAKGMDRPMFPDIEMPQMIMIAFEVLKDNLGNFTLGQP